MRYPRRKDEALIACKLLKGPDPFQQQMHGGIQKEHSSKKFKCVKDACVTVPVVLTLVTNGYTQIHGS
jgi:hypothetical protein